MKTEEAHSFALEQEKELGIPVVLPLEDGLGRLVSVFSDMIARQKSAN